MGISYKFKVQKAHKKVKLREQNYKLAEEIEKNFKTHPVISRILSARKIKDKSEIENFLNPSLKNSLPDIANLKNIKEAAGLITETIKAGKTFAICCDYDVDGLTSASILKKFVEELGGKTKEYIPDRFSEGYGLNERMISEIKKSGIDLLVCLDYGTSNDRELEIAKNLGLKSIVVDHHHVTKIPQTDIFVNPKNSECGFADGILCTAGLAWYLIIAISKNFEKAPNPKNLLDLAALGTICDMVPLKGVNRIIVKRGLELLENSEKIGLQFLKKEAGINGKVSAGNVGYGLGPRINAAGRMNKPAQVIELLTSNSESDTKKIAANLNELNKKRQNVESKIKKEVIKSVYENDELPFGIVASGDDYHPGVIGIVAQRLVEAFYRPSAVIGKGEEYFSGSVRGIKQFNVVEALKAVSENLESYGGHEGAGGFKIKPKNIEKFRVAFNLECEKRLKAIPTEPLALADTHIEFIDINPDLVESLKILAPHGIGNPTPTFLIKEVKVTKTQILKGSHLKITLTQANKYLTGFLWNENSHPLIEQGAIVDIVCKADVNLYQGNTSMQLNILGVSKVQ